jgi:hypothetical protein
LAYPLTTLLLQVVVVVAARRQAMQLAVVVQVQVVFVPRLQQLAVVVHWKHH